MTNPVPELDRESFERIALPHRSSLYRFALRLARRPDLAEDLVQDTYVRAFRAFHTFDPGTNVRAWLFQILRHLCINRHRAAKARVAEVEFGSIESVAGARIHRAVRAHSGGSDPESIVMNRFLPEELRRAMEELPNGFREAIEYAWFDELSYREIADRLSVPIGTVMSRIHRGRKLLRSRLQEFAASRRLIAVQDAAERMVA